MWPARSSGAVEHHPPKAAGTSTRGMRFTADQVDAMFCGGRDFDELAQISRSMKAMARESGRTIKTYSMLNLVIGETDEAGRGPRRARAGEQGDQRFLAQAQAALDLRRLRLADVVDARGGERRVGEVVQALHLCARRLVEPRQRLPQRVQALVVGGQELVVGGVRGNLDLHRSRPGAWMPGSVGRQRDPAMGQRGRAGGHRD